MKFLGLVILFIPDTSPRSFWTVEEGFSRLPATWVVKTGSWAIEKGALVGRRGEAQDGCGLIEYNRDLKNPSELEVDIALLEPIGGNAGLQIQFAGQKFYHYAAGSGIWPPYVTSPTALKREGTVRIRLRRTKEHYEFWVDGKLILNRAVGTAQEQPPGELKLWSAYGAQVRFDNLRVR